jgi:hypothetical protein
VTDLAEPVTGPTAAETAPPPTGRPAATLAQRLLPGERAIWRGTAIAIAALTVVLLVALLIPREVFLGSNSVAARDFVAPAQAGAPACVNGSNIRVPGGTGRVRFGIDVGDATRPALRATVAFPGGPVLHGSAPAAPTAHGFHKVDLLLDRPVPGSRDSSRIAESICIEPAQGKVFVWGRGQNDYFSKPVEQGGQKLPGRVALWFLPSGHERKPILTELPQIFERASLFRPGFYGPWLFWVLLCGALPALIYAGIRVLATAPARTVRANALRVFAIGFALIACWALVTPPFESPDESEHFAYTQYLVETGKAVDVTSTPQRPTPWSTQEAWAIDQTRELSTIERADVKAPWDPHYERDWQHNDHNLPKDNGGGYHPATSVHSPLYYSLLIPGYLIGRAGTTFDQLLGMRLVGALMGAATAMFAFLLVSELLPRRRNLAVAAGLLVAFLPEFGFISGAINNDNGVNMGCAALTWLMVRALRRGLTVPLALGMGLALVVTPLMKATGYELYPPLALGFLGLLARRHGRRDLSLLAAMLGAFVVVFLAWGQVRGHFHRDAFTTPGGAQPVKTLQAYGHIKGYLVWLWQVMVPFKLPFMRDFTLVHWPFFNIYVMRGFASFGWYAIFFPKWVYGVVTIVMGAMLVGGARLLWAERGAALRAYLPEILFLASIPIVVVAAVEAAYFTLAIPVNGTGEQGRYAFPAIAAVAAIVIAGCLGLGGRRRAPAIAAALVGGLAMMTLAGQVLTLSTFYS